MDCQTNLTTSRSAINVMNKKNKKKLADFDAQSWLFREFLDKMKRNNVKSIFCFTVDKYKNKKEM